MTARQAITNYEARLREYTNFTVRGIKKVCKECGPRPPCTPEERKAQEMMQKEMQSCCEETRMEEFRAAPKAFMGWVRLCVVLGFLAAVAYILGFAAITALLIVIAFVCIILEFLLYKQALDVFLPKKTSQNMVAIQKPSGEVKRRLILCGHSDSANEWSFTYYGDKLFKTTKLTMIFVGIAVLYLVLGLAVSLVATTTGNGFNGPLGLVERGSVFNGFSVVLAALFIPLSINWMFERKRLHVLGANDNLTGCFTAMAVARMLAETNARLVNTELVVLCSGCEEIGLRGAKAFVKAHAEEYKDVETTFIALDTMTDFDHMKVYITDLTSTIKHNPEAAALLQAGAANAGYDVPYALLPFGGSDAAAATQGGMAAVAFAAMDPAPAAYYHTRLDTCDALQPKTIEACLDIVVETAYLYDEAGLAPFKGSKVKAK